MPRLGSASVASRDCRRAGGRRLTRIVRIGYNLARGMMTCHLSERRPCRARRDILAAASAAAQMRTDIRHRETRPQLGDERLDRHDRIMRASVAPTEDVDLLPPQLAEDDGAAAALFLRNVILFHASHAKSRLLNPTQDPDRPPPVLRQFTAPKKRT